LPIRVLVAVACAWASAQGGCSTPQQGHARPPAVSVVGRSVLGAPIVAERFGGLGPAVLVIGLIHGDEPEGFAAIDDVRRVLAAERHANILLVPDMNPDGRIAGTRGNARGVDLNRNWPASNFTPGRTRGSQALSEPESRAVHALLATHDPRLVIVLHSIRRGGPFVNFDGPPPAERLAERFASAAAATGDARWRVEPSMGYPTPGSLGTYAGIDRGVPILTVELARGHDPAAARAALTAGFAEVLAAFTAD
jgi:predicted deacylase